MVTLGWALGPLFHQDTLAGSDQSGDWISAAHAGDGMVWAELSRDGCWDYDSRHLQKRREAEPGLPGGKLVV